MSRVHGVRQILGNSITDASLKAIEESVYDGIANDKLAAITTAGKVTLDAIAAGSSVLVLPASLGGTGVNNSTNTLTLAQPLEFSGTSTGVEFVTSGSGETVLTLPAGTATLASQAYVDSVAQGLDIKEPVVAATVTELANAVFGSGGTDYQVLTCSANVALPAIDEASPSVGQRVLIKNQSTTTMNGIYTVTSLGEVDVSPWILTRAVDCDNLAANGDTDEFGGGSFVFVTDGNVNNDCGFVVSQPNGAAAFGSSGIVFAQFSSAGVATAGAGLYKDGVTINMIDHTTSANGGSGLLVAGTYGGLHINSLGIVTQSELEATGAELNALHFTTEEVGLGEGPCDHADFELLHAITVSETDINDLVTSAALAAVTDGSAGGDLVGITGITNLLAGADTTAQAALEGIQAEIDVLDDVADGASGADSIGVTGITNLLAGADTTVQAALEAIQAEFDTLDDVTDGSSGADAIGVTAITGINAGAATTVQQALEELAGSSSDIIDYEYVGVGDGEIVAFDTDYDMLAGSLKVYVNGILQLKAAGADNVQETDANTFTFGTAPLATDAIIVSYRKAIA